MQEGQVKVTEPFFHKAAQIRSLCYDLNVYSGVSITIITLLEAPCILI